MPRPNNSLQEVIRLLTVHGRVAGMHSLDRGWLFRVDIGPVMMPM